MRMVGNRKSPWRFIKQFLLFLPVVVVSYGLFVCLWVELTSPMVQKNTSYYLGKDGHLFTRLKEVKFYKDIDVLFLGSSHSFRGIDTREFANRGLVTFNLGSASQTPRQTEILLKRYLDQLNPKLIVFEVFPAMVLSNDGVESSLDLISNDKNDFETVKLAFRSKHIRVINTLIYACYRDVFGLNEGYHEPKVKECDIYIDGGYVRRKPQGYKNVKIESKKWEITSDSFEDFLAVVHFIENKKIPLFLIQAPVTKNRYQSYINNIDFDNCMYGYGEYLNFNEVMQLTDSLHFYDQHHLNQDGVIIFNDSLFNALPNIN